ncbi:iron-containing alcohol dehydrogenase family protein [bacterium]|nr:iron-containing alcohol dehydrogenase family protein [bacterium]
MQEQTLKEDFMAAGDPVRQLVVSPTVVINGEGALSKVGEVARQIGAKALVIGGPVSYPAVKEGLEASLKAVGVSFEVTTYGRDCCEIDQELLAELIRVCGAEVIVGAGGGKAMDAAKLAAYRAGLPVINVPTSAATCAAWTALSNVYSSEGTWLYGVALPTNPYAVVVDHAVVATAPARLLASGIADTLAKWVESSASVDVSQADAMTLSAVEMARFLYERLMTVGEAAFDQAQRHAPGPELRAAIDANIQLAGTVGGLGGARCRSVAAHAVCNALTAMPGHGVSWHGEKVAFGIVVQRILQAFPIDEITRLIAYFAAIQVPVTLKELGVADDPQAIEAIAQGTVREGSSAHLLPGGVDAARVAAAISQADALGKAQRAMGA